MKKYHSIKELFSLADENQCSPGEIACRVEAEECGLSYDDVWDRMKKTIPVFRQAIQRGLADTKKSSSGLVGGDANILFMQDGRFLSPVCRRACAYAVYVQLAADTEDVSYHGMPDSRFLRYIAGSAGGGGGRRKFYIK